ncbi:MAG: PAS domain S-box protein, partial [Proteobacteria bacterium]|nr:PAS domain S-box protein [Pseudomonadota bacterium]
MTRAAVNSRLPLGFLMVAVLLTGAVLAWLMWEAISNLQATRRTVAREVDIEELRSAIVHLDEVLTMSALMAVATGDPSWVERYKEHEPKLDAAIKLAREIEPKAYIGEGAALIDRANMKIVAMEKMAFQYLEQDNPEEAQRLLLSEDYEKEKQTYARGMTRFAITPRLNLRLAQLRGRIVHLDEVLTMSARMAAVTGNEKWIDRYRGYEPELGAAIKEAKALAPEAFTREAADQTDKANTKLVDLEKEAFKLVGEERLQAAQDLLSSGEYNELKRVYAQGMQLFAQRLKSVASEDVRLARNKALLSGTATILVIPVLMIGWLFVLRTTRRWQAALVESNRDLGGQTIQLAELNRALEAEVAERKRAEKLQRGRSRVLERLAAGAPLEEVLSILVETAEAVEPDMLCSILLLDDEKKHLRHCAAPSLPDFYNEAVDGLEIGRGVGSCGEAAATGKRVIIEDVLTHPNWAPFRDLAKRAGVRAAWSEPVVSSTGATLATFAMYYREPRRPSPRQLELIASGAQLAGIAIDRKRVEAALQQAHDELEHRVRERTAELAAANQRFRQLAENIDAAFWLASPDEKELYYVSPAYETITNRSCESLYADPMSWLEALHPEDRERARAEAQARGSVPHDDEREGEFRTRRPDGSTGWIWVRSWPVYDGQDALVGRAGIAEDITERVQADQALRESEQRFRSAFDHTAVGMALLDLDGR